MRSVINRPTARCNTCQLPLRWCLCFAHTPVCSPLQLELLTHPREISRPTSSGNLIHRLFVTSRQHLWTAPNLPSMASVCNPDKEVWILHPNGNEPPLDIKPQDVQLVLLDGSWSESAGMSRAVSTWGRRIRLPLSGESRYWLRAKQEGERFSTAEALLFLLKMLKLDEAHLQLNLQFELLVYASFRARGQVQQAQAFLQNSPLTERMPEVLEQLNTKRSRENEADRGG